MVSCKACGKPVSRDATRCPHCGDPYPVPANLQSGCLLFVLLIGAGAVGLAIGGCGGMFVGMILGVVAWWLVNKYVIFPS